MFLTLLPLLLNTAVCVLYTKVFNVVMYYCRPIISQFDGSDNIVMNKDF